MNGKDIFEEFDSIYECVDGETEKERFLNAFAIYWSENVPEENVYIINRERYRSTLEMVSEMLRLIKKRCSKSGTPLPTIKFDEDTFVLSDAMVIFGYKEGSMNRLSKEHLMEFLSLIPDDANIGVWLGNQSDIVLNIMIQDILKSLS